ncbi:hypothetical protein SPRG_05922 [Saprolegnia parasitica CBS 223.65]|uniref:Uncharacterized protein n=1 Tax=Saprolegnia parasitica (strain CBS 223.65) TaxID=695850 RepID=A0A067CJL0_SAPPC|nr:hypothetical protein SPRG_05922 [Saprolegnia parasitica CBS 223.65]KDO29385.1 hypothetical protein SPRG_05922 [Saprolegnia parasitica CBS 223.65]|eukprot:XP_012199888.1 hypothetical protein SPRG_05922 [Saprolegnia parasitica CBS 223.65]
MSDDADLFAFVQGIMLPHCFSHKSQGTDLRMTIHGIDVDWPLAPAHAAALMATDQLRVLPPAAITSCAHLDNQDEWRHVLARLKLDGLHPFHVELAHVAIDSVGSASALRAPHGPPRTFATLLYMCPSDCVGGAVTITFDDRTTTYDALLGEYVVYFNTCTVSVAPIVSGTRGVLVYHVTYHELTCETAMVWAPPPLPSRAQIDQAIANQGDEDYCAMQVVLETPCAAPRFETLDGRDKAIVDWLLRAGCFDIAFMRVGEYHTYVWMDGCETPTYPITLLNATFHPQCATPALVQEACRWRSMSTYLYDDVTAFHEMDPTLACLVFWPKAHRLTLLGLPQTVRLLRSIVFDKTDHDNLGYSSRLALFAAATRLFISDTPGPRQDERTDEMLLEMACLLYDYGDAALLGEFLSEREWDGQDDMAAVVAMAVDRFGRAAMEAPLRNLSAFTSARFRYQVLEHLTQDNDWQHASWLYDIAHGWWAGARNSVAYPYMPPTEGKLVGALQLEAWLHAHAITPDVRALLALRLPLDVITGIRAALVNVPPLLQVLSHHPKGVRMLPCALWAVRTIALPPALHRAYVDLAVRCCCDGDANNDAGLAYLLLLTSGSDAFEVVAAVAASRRSSGQFQRTLQANATFSAEQTIALRPFISR